MENDVQVFQCTEKVFHGFSSQLCSKSLFFSLCEINCIKIQTMSLVLNLSILAEILCVLFTLMLLKVLELFCLVMQMK